MQNSSGEAKAKNKTAEHEDGGSFWKKIMSRKISTKRPPSPPVWERIPAFSTDCVGLGGSPNQVLEFGLIFLTLRIVTLSLRRNLWRK